MPPVACKVHAGMAVLAARGAAVSRCGGVSCRFLFSPVPFSDGLVGDRLFTFLQLHMEEVAAAAAVCCNVFTALGVDFLSRLHTSLYLSCGRPRSRLPAARSL